MSEDVIRMKNYGINRISCLVIACMFVALVPWTAGANAEVPTWNQGDEWAMGASMDLSDLQPALDSLSNLAAAEGGSLDASIYGEVGFYQIYTVSDTSGAMYTVDVHLGGGISIGGKFEASIPDYDEQKITVKGEGFVGVSVDVKGTMKFTKDTLALSSASYTIKVEMTAEYKGNIPDEDNTNLDLDLKGSIDATIEMSFDPPLDVLQYPIAANEEWVVESQMTVSGSATIKLSGSGLPTEAVEGLKEMFDTFPVDKTETFGPEIEDLYFEMASAGTKTVNTPSGSTTAHVVVPDIDFYGFGYDEYIYDDYEEYPYEEYDGEDDDVYLYLMTLPSDSFFNMLVSEEQGFMVGQEVNPMAFVGGMGVPVPGMSSDTFKMDMQPMTASDASKGMTSAQKAAMQDPRPTSLMQLLLIGGIVAAVVVVAVVLVSKRKKKAAAAGMMPGSGAPPGAYPPQQYPPQQYPPQQYPPQNPQEDQQPPPQYPPQGPQQYQQPPPQYPPKEDDAF